MVVHAIYEKPMAWRDPSGQDWTAVFYWANEDGRARLVGVDLHGFEGRASSIVGVDSASPSRLSAVAWRAFPLGRLADEAYRQVVAEWGAYTADQTEPDELVGSRGRRTRLDADHWREVKRVYESADPRRPTKAVAEHFGISHAAAAKQVARARSMGLLEPTKQGVAATPPGPSPKRRRRGTR